MATVDLDIAHLSSFCSLPDSTFTTLIDDPTVELVSALLQKISEKALEYDDLKSNKIRLEVELENAVRIGESKARGLKGSVEKGLKEIAELRAKLQEEENSRSSLQTELDDFKTSSTTSISEVTALRSRIESLEVSNRETLSLLEGKTSAYDKLAEELSTQHEKIVELRKQVATLEQSLQGANTTIASAKFREENLKQEINMLRNNNDWIDNEFKTKTAELLKYRKEKSAQIAELQRANEEATSETDALKKTESSLRSHIADLEAKYEEALNQTQQMEEEKAKLAEDHRLELDGVSRLAELHKKAADTARQRVQEAQASAERTNEQAAEEFGRIRAELSTEHSEKEAAERRVAELEATVERLESEMAVAQDQPPDGSPGHRQSFVGGFSTPRAMSPSGVSTPGSARLRSGITMTQLYSEYSKIKAELFREKKRSSELSTTLDDMMQDMENKAPEFEDLKANHDRLQLEMLEMSSLIEDAGKERDVAKKESRKWEGQVQGLLKEGEILRQQLRDLSAQVKVLMLEIHAHNEGVQLSAADRIEFEKMARGEIDGASFNDLTDTGRFISQSLVTFRNIQELQEQNVKLLKLTRVLGDQMEGQEAQAKKNVQQQEHQELLQLRERLEQYKDEMRSMATQSQSVKKERDMYRRMLTSRGHLAPDADHPGSFMESVNGSVAPGSPPTVSVLGMSQISATKKESVDYDKLFKELQQHFDTYREETSTDHATLKGQVDELSKKNGELQSDAMRSNGQLRLAQERHEMLQKNYDLLKAENAQLQKRYQTISETATKQELKAQQLVEETFETRSLLDSVRNETSNLKAEKEMWKNIEKRLQDDNENLRTERNRLNGLTSSLQNLLNEKDLSEAEVRRRLQTRVESLEAELQGTKRKLNDEMEDAKKTALRREYEQQQSQKRIDDLTSGLSAVREELVAVKTTRDHLQARVDELTVELRSAEEKAEALQHRPARAHTQETAGEEEQTAEESSISREQELAVEVSELKRDLELAKAELENAKDQVEQYKSISQSSEEQLASLNDAHDEYRGEMDKQLEQKDVAIRELEKRIELINSELATTNSQLTALRDEQAGHTKKLEEQKGSYETEIARLKEDNEKHSATAQFYQEDLRAQAEIAQQAQQNYESELLKHAEAAKALQKARNDYNELRTEIADLKAKSDAAENALAQEQQSNRETGVTKDRIIADLNARKSEVEEQNKRLYQQLEDSSKQQLEEFRKGRSLPPETEEGSELAVSGIDNLQEVIKYLRREKEIVDVQLELATQENSRLRQRFEFTQTKLDEARLKLDEQRRLELDTERNTLNHNKLMETINELNLFRESSVTLRNEARQAEAALAEKTKQYDELRAQVEPNEARMRELESDIEAKLGEIKLLQDDRNHWQQRTQSILQKYDRIDPAEFEALKEKMQALEGERDQLIKDKESLSAQIGNVEQRIQQAQETVRTELRQRLGDQYKARSKQLSERINAKVAELQQAIAERDGYLSQLRETQQQLHAAQIERNEALAVAQSAKANNAVQPSNDETKNGQEPEEGQVLEPAESNKFEDLQKKVQEAEARANSEAAKVSSLTQDITTRDARIAELEKQVNELQKTVENLNSRISAEHQDDSSQQDTSTKELSQLRAELAAAQREVESLKAAASATAAVTNPSHENGEKSVADQISEQVELIRVELEKRHTERVQHAEDLFNQRADRMRKQLSQKLADGKAQIRHQIEQEYQEKMNQLKNQHKQQIQELTARHQSEINELRANEELRFEQFKKIHAAETAVAKAESANTAEPAKPAEPETPSATTTSTPTAPSDLKEDDVQRLIQTNPFVKRILFNNIQKNVTRERDSVIAKLREEQEKVLVEKVEEVERKASSSQAQAVQLAEKRSAVRINMAETRARNAQAKIDIIEKAAQDTPQRPVGEVWGIAKVAKAVLPNHPSIQRPPSTPPIPPTFQQQQKEQPPPTSQASLPPPVQAPLPAAQVPQPPSLQNPQAPAIQSAVPTPEQKNVMTPNQINPVMFPPAGIPPIPQQQLPEPPTLQQHPIMPNPFHGIPPKPLPGLPAMNHHPNAGLGSMAIRGINHVNSGLPTARGFRGRGGQVNQGSHIPSLAQRSNQQSQRGSRGRGGRGRGNQQQHMQPGVMQQQQQQPGQGQPNPINRIGMNPTARQFVPGNKRAREDSGDANDGVEGKRVRGPNP